MSHRSTVNIFNLSVKQKSEVILLVIFVAKIIR